MGIDWATGQGRITVAGKALEWGARGAPEYGAPVFVLLHEGLGCLALWRDFPERLAQVTGCAVVAYSRAGYGQSDPVDLPRPLDYMTREATGVLPGVLDAIGAARVILLGHSDGATIAAEYAGRVPHDPRLCGLVLMAPHFFAEDPGLQAIAQARTAYESGDLRTRLARYHADPDIAFHGWNGAWLDPGFRAWHVGDVVEGWRVPALVIQGRDDQYGTLAQVAEAENRAPVPVETLVLEGCRHAPQFEQPDAVLTAVRDFTARLRRPEAAPLGA